MGLTARVTGRHGRQGVTLIEIMVVVAIISVMAAIMLGVFTGASERGFEEAAKAQLLKIRTALDKRMDWLEGSGYELDAATYRQWFPENFGQANPPIVPPVSGNHLPATTNVECLVWMLLGAGRRGKAVLTEERFTAEQLRDTDKDGLYEFIDPWGNPLRFENHAGGFPGEIPEVVSAGPDGLFAADTGNAEDDYDNESTNTIK